MTQPHSHASSPDATDPAAARQPSAGGNKMTTIVVLLVAVLIMVGGVAGVLMMGSGNEDVAGNRRGAVKSFGDPVLGKQVTMKFGCITCHSDDGSRKMGPSYKGLFGSTVKYDDGSTGVIDAREVRSAITNPTEKVMATYEANMPKAVGMTEDDIQNLIAYLESIGAGK